MYWIYKFHLLSVLSLLFELKNFSSKNSTVEGVKACKTCDIRNLSVSFSQLLGLVKVSVKKIMPHKKSKINAIITINQTHVFSMRVHRGRL